jgi:hypothetical protein
MKKILIISLVAVLALFTSCISRLSEDEKNSDYYNTLIRGAVYHNQIVLLNQDQKILENQELIIKQNEEILKALNEKN